VYLKMTGSEKRNISVNSADWGIFF
jgi:hypothetical protein